MKWLLLLGALWALSALWERFRPRREPFVPKHLGFSPAPVRAAEPEVLHSHLNDDSTALSSQPPSEREPDFIVIPTRALPPPRCAFCGHIFLGVSGGVCEHCGGLR